MASVAAQVDLHHPGAGISDPLAGLAPLGRDCAPGQTDINTASAATLATTLTASKPTVERVVEARPFLRARDAISVPGIGPAQKALLESTFCASPTDLPPAATHAPKAGFTGVDLQVATAEEIASLGVPKPVAQRLADYGPLPDDLSTIATPAVPGLTQRLIDSLKAKAAITPYPFTYQGKTWKWVSHDHGATVTSGEDDRYALYVPRGAVTGDGAWATVTVLPMVEGALPAVDPHIHGTWTGEVGVQLPASAGGSAANSYVLHEAADGLRISMFDAGVADGPNGTLVTAATSLSTLFTAQRPTTLNTQTGGVDYCGASSFQSTTLWCEPAVHASGVQTRDQRVDTVLHALRRSIATYPPVPTGPCPNGNPLITVTGSMWSMACNDSSTGTNPATFTWTNSSGTFLHFGNVYAHRAGGAATVEVHRSDKHGILTTHVLNETARRANVILPGDAMVVSIGQGAGTGWTSTMTGDHPENYWALSNSLGALDMVAGDIPTLGAGWMDCMNTLDNPDANTAMSCLSTATEKVLGAWLEVNPTQTTTRAKVASAKAAVMRLAGAAFLVDEGTSAIRWFAEVAPDRATYVYENPRPVVGAGPGASPMGGGYIALTPTQGFFVDIATQQAREIATAGDWNCYATGYYGLVGTSTPGIDGPRLTTYGNPVIVPEKAPTCTSLPRTWDYVSVHHGGNIADGVLIRQPDWLIRWSGFINHTGQIQWDTNGVASQCLYQHDTPIVLNFPQSAIDAWTAQPGAKGDDLTTCPL